MTEVPESWKKRTRSEIYLSTYFWGEAISAPRVLMFGHGGVLCHNSPHTLDEFLSFDVCSSHDGGFVLFKREAVLSWLRGALAPGHFFLQKIHGPIPYLLGQIRKLSGIRVAPQTVVDRFSQNPRNNTATEAIPWSISGTLPELGAVARRAAIEQCPEIKMVFPALDSPACFGASSTLDKDACVASLCVSSPKPGGC